MALPTVTRPLATMNEKESRGSHLVTEAVQWAKWVVLAAFIIGVVLLCALGVVTMNERKHSEQVQQEWDQVYGALKSLKDEPKPEEQIAALEAAASKVNGTTAHAYVLVKLGNLYFEQAMKPEKFKEDRDKALDKAMKLYEVVATQEPYKSNPAFGPLAVENLALAKEQARDYNGAIDVLSKALGTGALDSHVLNYEMLAHLGRMYWLRSEQEKEQARDAKGEEANKLNGMVESDRKLARSKLSDALRESATREEHSSWRQEAEYIKSLIPEKPGVAMADGKVPPLKPAKPSMMPMPMPMPRGPGAIPKMNFNLPPTNLPPLGAQPLIQNPQIRTTPVSKPAENKDAKKDENPAPAPKKEEKADDKKKDQSSLEAAPGDIQSVELGASGPSGHLSFAQMQQALKSGKSVFCQCPRCATQQKTPSAHLVE